MVSSMEDNFLVFDELIYRLNIGYFYQSHSNSMSLQIIFVWHFLPNWHINPFYIIKLVQSIVFSRISSNYIFVLRINNFCGSSSNKIAEAINPNPVRILGHV